MKTIRAVGTLCFLLMGTVSVLLAQMVDPALDKENEPFCYFSKPTDVIGVMDGKQATLVSPEGYLYTGFGELMFFTGNPPEPVQQRVKTLSKGYLPVVEYDFDRGGFRYHVMTLASTLDGNPESPLMNFVRVRVENVGKEHRTAWFTVAMRYQNDVNTDYGFGDNRFHRPATASHPGGYEQAGVKFDPAWTYGFQDDMALRDGKVLFLFPTREKHTTRMTLRTGENEPQEMGIYKLPILPTSPVDVVTYALPLNPHEEKALDFRMPYEPIPMDSSLVRQLRDAPIDEHLQRTVRFWEKLFAQGLEITVPEEKLNNTFKANLVYDLIARNRKDGFIIQTVNDFHYHAFWLRDASYIIRMYDLSGYHDIAKECLEFFPRWQQPDGNYLSQGGQYDGWGQAMWAFGQHFRLTHDTAWARSVYPSVQRAVAWLQQARRDDPLHIMPKSTPGDNENVSGHVTGHNFWALAGLKNVIALAEGLGNADDAAAYRKEYDAYRATLVDILHDRTKPTKGYIPPGLDSIYGSDWGNMLSVYPEQILDPFDPMVTATLKATRAKYQEGIMTYDYGRYLHHYLTMKNTETEVIRGDQQTAIEELYAILLHTGSTHTGFEFSILPWGTRDFGMNLTPHGWFAAKFRALVRNMMVREEGNDLHLFSCISPEWVRDGKSIAVHRAPTNVGEVNADWAFTAGKAVLTLADRFTTAPERIVLHLPWFMNVSSVMVDGKRADFGRETVILPLDAKKITIAWTKRKGTTTLSYDGAVREYKKEYRQRYEKWIREGN